MVVNTEYTFKILKEIQDRRDAEIFNELFDVLEKQFGIKVSVDPVFDKNSKLSKEGVYTENSKFNDKWQLSITDINTKKSWARTIDFDVKVEVKKK